MSFKIAVVQFNPIRKNVQQNIQTVEKMLLGIKADLIVLPELANSGYLYETQEVLRNFSEPKDGSGPFISSLRRLAQKTGGAIVSGYAESHENGIYNSAAAVSSTGVIQNYRKTHLFENEKDLFLSGNSGFHIFLLDNVKIGMMICFDWIFPEAARSIALLGANIIAHPANLVLPYCQDAMVTRSIENHVFTVTANRIGHETTVNNKLKFTGKSQITDPLGRILYRGPENKATVHVMEIDPSVAEDKKINPRNDLFQDRCEQYYRISHL
jgi:predicted amidohydrolase